MSALVRRVGRRANLLALQLLMLLATGWGVLALRYWDHAGPWVRDVLALAYGIGSLVLVIAFGMRRWRWRAAAVFTVLFGLLLARWYAIAPSNDRNWQPE